MELPDRSRPARSRAGHGLTQALRSAPHVARASALGLCALTALTLAGCGAPTEDPPPPTPVLPAPATLPAGETPPSASLPPEADPPPPAPADSGLAVALQPLLDDWLQQQGVPGAVLGLRLADGRTAVLAAGSTDDVDGEPIQPGHRFRIGSITKTFVATLVLQLVDEGLVDLDEPAGAYLPEAPFAGQVTVRQLLSHTSGVPDFGRHEDYARLILLQPAREWTPTEVLALVEDQPLDFEPGSRTAYSNTNYTLAGMIVETTTGQPLADALRQRILEPAGMETTFLEGMEPAPEMDVAGHFDINMDGQPDNVRAISYTGLVTSGSAAGGLSSNALDMLQFSEALFRGQLVSHAALDEAVPAQPGEHGLGIISASRDGMVAYGHDGALPGFAAAFAYLPEVEVSIVALSNQTGADVHGLISAALAEVMELR
ncbi:MAG TPA: serine hydrolase domain-containing protein [Candidatus Limnocylindrales bacterium]|nr:serine hydrolase domain-containing protein [Candidatus Limnocylindrales bacterium]